MSVIENVPPAPKNLAGLDNRPILAHRHHDVEKRLSDDTENCR
jgi:hypothetical protein